MKGRFRARANLDHNQRREDGYSEYASKAPGRNPGTGDRAGGIDAGTVGGIRGRHEPGSNGSDTGPDGKAGRDPDWQ